MSADFILLASKYLSISKITKFILIVKAKKAIK